ncbi:MAG: metal ABC transporter permease [Pirellulales bacterium]
MNWPDLSPEASMAFWTILVGAVSNAACALIGCYLVLRRLSLLGDAISHAILPGIVLAFLLTGQISSLPMLLGAMAVGMLTTFLTHSLHDFGQVPEDASMGAVFTSLFALGVILVTNFVSSVHLDADCVLYGDIVNASLDTVALGAWEVPRVLGILTISLAGAAAFVTLFWKELKIVSFDPQLATSMGLTAGLVHYLLMGVVAGVTVASFEAVGSILVVAMLIVPAATAHLLTDRLVWMIGWAVLVGVIASVLGYLSAAWLNTSVAGMMAVAAGAQFGLAVLLAPRHGLVSKMAHQLALTLRIAGEDLVARLYRLEERQAQPYPQPLPPVPDSVAAPLVRWLATLRLRWRGEVQARFNGDHRLTDKGRRTAQSLVRAHRLWESFLGEHFQLPLDHLHEPAERVEHFIGPDLQERLATELDRPGVDPHGKQIPPER